MSKLTAYDKFIQQALKYGFSLFGTAKTGITTQVTAYDDGYYLKGYPRSGDRFVDNGDGTITDRASGLMWAKDGNGAGCNNGNTITWASALGWANALNFAGHTDWRIPNIKEIMSIADYSSYNPALDASVFPNESNEWRWSSTTYKNIGTSAWYVNFYTGQIDYTSKALLKHVRAVRLGVPAA